MPLQPESKEHNLAASLTAWLRAKLVTIEGVALFLGGEPVTTRPAQWVHVDFLFGVRRTEGREVGTRRGARAYGILNVLLCVKREGLSNVYAMEQLRDKAGAYLQPGQSIPLKDYGTGGNPTIGAIECLGLSEASVDDGLTTGLMVRALSVDIAYQEAFTWS
jgi:hypothetical protein